MTEEEYNQKRAELADIFQKARKSKGFTYESLAEIMNKGYKGNTANKNFY